MATATRKPRARRAPRRRQPWNPDSVTGLYEDDIALLSFAQKRELVGWSEFVIGHDGGRPFYPQAVRRLELEYRLVLADDHGLTGDWMERERRRVIASPHYLLEGYGHLQPEVGPPVPFLPWPEQTETLEVLLTELRIIILKARQLGMTWLCLHYAVWLLAFAEHTPRAKILALSKHGEDATALVVRARRILELLPMYLRPEEEPAFRNALQRLSLVGRGEMKSLPSTPGAARQETATLTLLDEFGHVKNAGAGPTWTAVQSTLGDEGQGIVLSTGNGPKEAPGDGQQFAKLWTDSSSGELTYIRGGEEHTFATVFLPASTDPRRTEAWRERERKLYPTPEEFAQEHPETEEEALAGVSGTKFYPPAGINAAERLGRHFDALLEAGELPPPAKIPEARDVRGVTLGFDWGEQTHGLVLYPLEGGGVYVTAEYVSAHAEPEAAVAILDSVAELEGRRRELEDEEDGAHLAVLETFDSAGIQSNRTFVKNARNRVPHLRSRGIPFGSYKDETTKYLRRLFRRSWLSALLEDGERERAEKLAGEWAMELPEEGPLVQLIAISPRCPVLLRQLRGLSFDDDDSGKVEKGDDHGPDGLVAGEAPTARRHRELLADSRETPA